MKKKFLLYLLAALSIVTLTSCGTSSDKSISTSSTIDTSEVTVKNGYEAYFQGDWNKSGLFEKDGSIHVTPDALNADGMIIDVTDYGAKADDPGFDNYKAFKTAIENANDGDIVKIPRGKFYFKSYSNIRNTYYANIALKSNIKLQGEGIGETILVSCFDENINRDKSTTVIAACNVEKVVISDLTVTSNTSDDKLPDPNNSNLQTEVYTAPKYGVTIGTAGTITTEEEATKNVVVDSVLVEKFQRMGVRVSTSRDITVKNSTFQKATCLGGGGMGYGVCIQGYNHTFNCTDTALDARFNIVENCNFIGPYIRHGALIQYYAHNNIIRNNTFDGTLLDSIDMHGEFEYSNEICNNTIKNTRSGAAIGLGNTGATHAASGENNFVHDNTIIGCARAMDVILGTNNTIIYNNTIKDCVKGITCNNANGTYIAKNSFSNIDNDGINITYSYNADFPEKGIPNKYIIKENNFSDCKRGIYLETYNDIEIKDNTFNSILEANQIIDEKSKFVLPEKSSLTEAIQGDEYLPSQNFFITTESKDKPATYQKNLKLKTSNLEPQYNRMIYALFDKSEMPKNYSKVYLCMTAKAQVGKPTINVHYNQTFVDWTEDTICWNNTKLHHDSLALVKNTEEDPVFKLVDFTFPVASYEFNTYYIEVTDAFKEIKDGLFTILLSNENIDESYMEVYSGQQLNGQGFRFIFV